MTALKHDSRQTHHMNQSYDGKPTSEEFTFREKEGESSNQNLLTKNLNSLSSQPTIINSSRGTVNPKSTL
jgi:hypothetical protein